MTDETRPEKEWVPFEFSETHHPHVAWAHGPARPFFLPEEEEGQFHAVMLRLEGITPQEFEAYVKAPVEGAPRRPTVIVPPLHTEGALLPDARNISVIVSSDFVAFLAEDDFLRGRVMITTLGPVHPTENLDFEPQLRVAPRPQGPAETGTVVVGIIDGGIAFANERFRTQHYGTRVDSIWLQGAPRGQCSWGYGREYRKAEIDVLTAECSKSGFFDEDRFYRETGLIDFSRQEHKAAAWRASHGTFVMDLAAGFDPEDDRLDRPIVAVNLPSTATADTSGARLDGYVLDGILFILERADRIAESRGCGPLPVVINFSYGLLAGPHDGTSPLEEAIDAIVAARSALVAPLTVCLPAGNGHLSRTHASVDLGRAPKRGKATKSGTPVQQVSLDWRVQPDDRASSFMEIWLPPPSLTAPEQGRITVTLTPPDGPASPPLGERSASGYCWGPEGFPVASLSYFHVPNPTNRGCFFLALLPTFNFDRPALMTPAGLWTITLEHVAESEAVTVEAWIQRGDTPYGFPDRGRQSYFAQPCYRLFDVYGRQIVEDSNPFQPPCVEKRESLVNAIATGERPIVAGGFLRQELTAAAYSAGGPIGRAWDEPSPKNERKPDAVLPSDDSKVFTGILASGSRSNTIVNFNGTSGAAPQLARWAAEQLAQGLPADREAVKQAAEAQEHDLPAWKPDLPAHRGGWGRISKVAGLPIVKLPR